jgi:hypothetical protein
MGFWYTWLLLIVGISLIILGENEIFMYKNVLLTDKEIALLKTIISQTLAEKITSQAKNLTIIHNRLRDIKPTQKYNQSIN